MSELIKKLESASEGSRELDVEILAWSNPGTYRAPWHLKNHNSPGFVAGCKKDGLAIGPTGLCTVGTVRAPEYTSSVNDAIKLAEKLIPGCYWELHRNRVTPQLYHANLGSPSRTWLGTSEVPALALCIALLKALETGGEDNA